MERLSRDKLQQLLDIKTELAVTVYMPMQVGASPPHITENQIRFKNLTHKAAAKLRQKGKHLPLAEQLEQLAADTHDDLSFWEQQTPALLITATPEQGITMLQLPIDTEEYVAVDRYFHLGPMMGLVADAREFYVLTLQQQDPKLYFGDMFGLQPTDIELPKNAKEALNLDEINQKSENQGTAVSRDWFNGRGGARNPQEEDRQRFWRLLDHQICHQANTKLPLVLAGIDADVAEYRELSKYPQSLQASLSGNHGNTELRELFTAAQAIIWHELVEPAHVEAIEEYERLSGANPGRVARTAEAILEAAKAGRIDKLLTHFREQTADTVRDQAVALPRLTFPTEAQESKRVNEIALRVWQTSGSIYNLTAEEMPGGRLMAARLRY